MSESTKPVFLSYASQDADAASRICRTLREAGMEVWLDQSELRGGDAWDAAIRKQIKSCALFMPIISASTSARTEGYFRLEWKLAIDRSHLESKQYVDAVTFAEIHCALGEVDEALRWYEKAFLDRTPNMVYAAILPRISPGLAGNTRYRAIIDRMGL